VFLQDSQRDDAGRTGPGRGPDEIRRRQLLVADREGRGGRRPGLLAGDGGDGDDARATARAKRSLPMVGTSLMRSEFRI